MSNKQGKTDGGPAFPTQCEQFLEGPQGLQPASAWGMEGKPGMSLRDWFAGKALAGMCANNAIFASNGMSGWGLVNCTQAQLAELAFSLADEMLRRRSQ